MKSLTCDICDFEAEAATFEEWFAAMQSHYMTAHADIMKDMMTKPKEDGDKWVAEAKARFDAAPIK